MKHPDFAERFRRAVSWAQVDDTQEALAKLLNVSGVMIWSYRNGEKLPRMSTAVRIAEKLGVNVNWLLTGTGSMVQDQPEAGDDAPSPIASRQPLHSRRLSDLQQALLASMDGLDIGQVVDVITYARQLRSGNLDSTPAPGDRPSHPDEPISGKTKDDPGSQKDSGRQAGQQDDGRGHKRLRDKLKNDDQLP